MEMYTPPPPGEVILEIFLRPQHINTRKCAEMLDISPPVFQRLLKGKERIDADLADRLSTTLGFSAQAWLNMQASYDRWLARLAAQDCPS